MSAKLYCVVAVALGSTIGACLPAGSKGEESEPVQAPTASAAEEVPLKIGLVQFPTAYQARWAPSADKCDGENIEVMSLQGKLLKFHESVGTMTQGERDTARTMVASFDFVGEGEEWTKSIAFEMSEDRQKLTRTELPEQQSFRYVRCPKIPAAETQS